MIKNYLKTEFRNVETSPQPLSDGEGHYLLVTPHAPISYWPLITHYSLFYSVLKLFTGLAIAALNVRMQSIIKAIKNIMDTPAKNIHQLTAVL